MNSFSEQLIRLLKDERFGKRSERTIPKRRQLVDIQPEVSVTEEQARQLHERRMKSIENKGKKLIKKEPDTEMENFGSGLTVVEEEIAEEESKVG